MQPSQGIEVISPIKHVGEAQYAAIWQKIFVTLLAGFWGRFMFVVFVLLAVFFGIRRRNPRAAAMCAIIAAVIAYGASAVGYLKLF